MTVPCFNCNTTTTLEVNFEVEVFACPACNYVYKNKEGAGLSLYMKSQPCSFENTFEIGKTAVFDNIDYQVTGLVIKSHQDFEWREYILQAKNGSFLYLSESDGHWILLNEITFDTKVGNHPLTVEHNEITYDRYDYYYPKLVASKGFFDFDIYKNVELIEYIHPPFLLSFEKVGHQQTAFLGKHISTRAIKKAFATTSLPSKRGIGQVQPFLINVRNTALIFCSIAFLILITHWFLNKDRVEQKVLDTSIAFDEYAKKDFITPSFELKGSSAPLTIQLHSNVDNSWANVQVALINEKNGDEVYANKDIEYYHGYTDGENWTEGDTSEEFNICGVAAGKYHLAITPMKATEDSQNQTVQIQASWSSPSTRNVWMIYIFMTVFVVAIYYLEKSFEEKRWE